MLSGGKGKNAGGKGIYVSGKGKNASGKRTCWWNEGSGKGMPAGLEMKAFSGKGGILVGKFKELW